MQQFRAVCEGNKIFLSADGELGLASGHARQGDTVCVIKDAVKPCILREREYGQWMLVCGNSFMVSKPNCDDVDTNNLDEFHIV